MDCARLPKPTNKQFTQYDYWYKKRRECEQESKEII